MAGRARAEASLPGASAAVPTRTTFNETNTSSNDFKLKAWPARSFEQQGLESQNLLSNMLSRASNSEADPQPEKVAIMEGSGDPGADEEDSEQEYLLESPGKTVTPKVSAAYKAHGISLMENLLWVTWT